MIFLGPSFLGANASTNNCETGSRRMTEIDASAPDTLAAIVGRLDARGAAPALAVLDRDALHEVAAATLAGDARRRRAALAVQGVARGERVALFAEKPFANELWLEHPVREDLPLPSDARTRRYGDTAITTIVADP